MDPDLTIDVLLAKLLAVWRGKVKGEALPAWKDFDLVDFRGWYGLLLLTDHSHPAAPSCKLYGSKLSDHFGADFTGRHPAELFGEQRGSTGLALVAHLDMVVRERKPALATFDMEMPHRIMPRNKVLSLPLAAVVVLSAWDMSSVRRDRFGPANAGTV